MRVLLPTLVFVAATALPATAIDIGDGASLPWEGDAEYGLRVDYDLERLPDDVIALLQPDVGLLVRYETLRRASEYLSVRGAAPETAAPIRRRLSAVLEARGSDGGARAAFDVGCFRALIDGKAYVPNAPTRAGLRAAVPELAYVVGRLDPTAGIPAAALDAVREGTLLARNLLRDFDHEYATLAALQKGLAPPTGPLPPVGFPAPPPVPDADPSVRYGVTLLAPWRLVVDRREEGTAITWASETPWRVRTTLGHHMVLGTRIEYGLFVDGKRVGEHDAWELNGGEPLEAANSTSFLQGVPTGAVVRARVQIFETDIPGQHHWAPSRGRYRVLWEHTYEATVP